jgi:curved DNA-binding protein CbpA
MEDYYEFLQISPSAEPDTIHRVYRFLAARYHPDNQETGNKERFYKLTKAYEILSDPDRRAAYDGELNRRLAVLAILYAQRRTTPNKPEVSFREIERRLGFPRDYLDFTAWYLRTKGFVQRSDNAEFAITAEGVDFVETQRENTPVLEKLLTVGGIPTSEEKEAKVVSPN